MKHPLSIILSRNNPDLNFGQIVEEIGYNEFLEEFIVRPLGDKNKYSIHYMEIYNCENMYDYEKLENHLEVLDKLEKDYEKVMARPDVKKLLEKIL